MINNLVNKIFFIKNNKFIYYINIKNYKKYIF